MTLHALAHERRQPPARKVRRNGLLQLGASHFLLLVGILGGLLGLIAFVLYAYLASV